MYAGEFKGKVAILIGMSKDGGKPIIRRFMQEGLITVVGSRSDSVVDLYQEVGSEFEDAEGFAQVVDSRSEESIKSIIDNTYKKYGKIDILCYNSAAFLPMTPIEELTEDIVDGVLSVNLKGPMFFIKHIAPIMKAQRSGSIVITSSWYGRKGVAFFAPYCASKAAVISLTQSAALELAPYGIRVNNFAPGDMENENNYRSLREEAKIRGISYEEMTEITLNNIPLHKRLTAEQMAGCMLFLCSEDAAHITAETMNVSGGSEFR